MEINNNNQNKKSGTSKAGLQKIYQESAKAFNFNANPISSVPFSMMPQGLDSASLFNMLTDNNGGSSTGSKGEDYSFTGNTVKDFVGKAISQLGVSEETGNNDGQRVSEYLTDVGLGSGNPWCAAFVCSMFKAATDGKTPMWGKTGSVPTIHDNAKQAGYLQEASGYTPKKGDLILFGDNDHIGIVESVENGVIKTVEGNTSNSVARREYNLGDSNVTSFVKTDEWARNTGVELQANNKKGLNLEA